MALLIEDYLRMGMALVAIPAHTKGPRTPGWEKQACTDLDKLKRGNVGIIHALSGTCCLDVDDEPRFLAWWSAQGFSQAALDALRKLAPTWTSGRPGRWKALFRAPEGLRTIPLHHHGFELRAAGGQDVLPPSVVVDDAGNEWSYHWLTDPKPLEAVPALPARLLERVKATPRAKPAEPSSLLAAALGMHPEGGRNTYVSKAVYAMMMGGAQGEVLQREALTFNAEHCNPPLDEDEVLEIVRKKERLGIEPPEEVKAVMGLNEFMPDGFRIRNQRLEASVGDAEGETWVPVLEYPLAVTNVIRIPGVQEQRYIEVTVANGPEVKHLLTMQQIGKECEMWLNNIGVSCTGRKTAMLKNFLILSKDKLEREKKVMQSYRQFGWQEDGSFLIGNRIYQRGEAPHYVHLDPHAANLARYMPLQGTWQAWSQAVQPLMHNDLQRFAFTMSLAAVLMHLSGERGGLFSIVGPSGQGKSTVQAAVASVFGNVEAAFSKAQDTENARIAFLSVMHNLPVQAEELTKLAPDKLAVLAYDVSEGRDKRRLDRSGVMREMAPEWHTILTSSSNAPILEKLLDQGSVAEAFRVLEMRMYLPEGTKFQDGDLMKREALANAGAAGHVLAQYLVDNREVIAAEMEKVRTKAQADIHATTEERIRVNMVAAATVMALILNKALRLEVDVAAVYRYGLTLILAGRTSAAAFNHSAGDILTTFINEHIDHCVQTNDQNVVMMIVHTKAPYYMRYEKGSQKLYIDVRTLRRFVLTYRMDWSEFRLSLKTLGILDGERKVTLTRGATGLPPQGQTMCVELDARKIDVQMPELQEEAA